ncbi:uncharacterized protein LOC111343852 [Stylophora pistillata]|uniref:uncharacterized protein LOC111343852 n=1 Tax=Stylophora pistillata TaxID=50429 RepID=UPI000C0478CF|nr:uncharacterized protein LOC111343852 [Stylophora pistillata]
MEQYPDIKGTNDFLVSPVMQSGMKEDAKRVHGLSRTKDLFTFDEGLAAKQAPFMSVRPLVSALQALEPTGEVNVDEDEPSSPDPDHIKALIEDAIVLLGNAHCCLNSWRQQRFAEYLTDVGKHTLKDHIPADKHLFPEKFHNIIKEEHDHANTNRKLVAQPPTATTNPIGHAVEATQNVADYQLPSLQDIIPPDNLVAGRIKYFYSNWTLITSDPWILSIVQGYKFPFVCQPIQWRQRQTKAKSKEDLASINEAISQLQTKGAVKAVQEKLNQFTSTLFIVKQTTKERPVFNLKNLNRFVDSQQFKIEGLEAVRKLIQSGDFIMKLDLQDAYLSVPIHNSHKKYLRFVFQGITYELQCLPFGLSSAPRTFTKLLKPVIILLRRQGIRIVIYLDDMLILDQSPERLSSIFQSVVALLQRLGFLIKQEKCSQAPSQCLEFLGSLINSKEMTQAVPNEKLQNLQLECKNALNNRWLTLKEFSALLGRMNQCSQVGLVQGPLHYRALQRQHINSVHRNEGFCNKMRIYLTRDSLNDLQWSTSTKIPQFNKCLISLPPFDMIVYTDASKRGWGAHYNGRTTGGRWDIQESRQHINILELRAALLGIRSFLMSQVKIPQHIALQMDNSTAVAYVNKRGGTRSSTLAALAVAFWNVCQQKSKWASRHFNERTEWTLDRSIFIRIVTKYYTLQVDLFASRLNHQLPRYVSRHPDPVAMGIDAMMLQWNKWTSFIHAPIVMLPRILKKIREDQATCLLIAPNWPGQSWYALLLEMLVDIPAILPMSEKSLYLPFDLEAQHPLWKTMKLVVWPLSGNVAEQEAFHRKFAKSLWPPGEKERKKMCHGLNVSFQRL